MNPPEPFSASAPLLSEDLSAGPRPLRQPTGSASHVLVIGAGVAGLVTSWILLDSGYRVTIVSKEWASFGKSQRLSSQISGALWELPPTQCGGIRGVDRQLSPGDLRTVQSWAEESFKVYQKMASDAELARATGVAMRMCTILHNFNIADDEITYSKMEVAKQVSPNGFHWGLDLVDRYDFDININAHGGLKDAYEHLAPVIDTDVAMGFLMRLVSSKGAKLVTAVIGDAFESESDLLKEYGADVIVNAAGMGARQVAADRALYPLRGAVLRVVNDGSRFRKIESSIIVTAAKREDGEHEDIAFVVPRNDNTLIMGSIEQPNEYGLNLTVSSSEIVEMRQRCEELLPMLKDAQLDIEYPLAQGLRPYRDSRIRLEREGRRTIDGQESRIVHCYGHGGGGWSLAFGSSRECARLVAEVTRPRAAL